MRNSSTAEPVELRVPASKCMIGLVQHSSQWFVRQAGIADKQQAVIELAVEELMLLLLHYSFDDGKEEGELEIAFKLDDTMLRIEFTCRALPFDLSMVPEHEPGTAEDASLSALLLKHMADRYRLVNGGKDGYRVELDWLRPLRHVADLEKSAADAAAEPSAAEPPRTEIRALKEDEALALARLVYRSYGYSYISEYLYYPERISARLRNGTLQSWVAACADGELAGHVALLRSTPQAQAVEWGIAVVDPRWRGGGLMKRISTQALRKAANSSATVLFGQAVTNHPYSQKACIDLGLVATALLLGFCPTHLKFRHISDGLSQRESTFLAVRLLKPLPARRVYLPPDHAASLRRLAQAAGISLQEPPLPASAPALASSTAFESVIETDVNVAIVNISTAGADHAAALARERRRLCLEKVDVIYLNIDLTRPAAPLLTAAAEAEGFFFAGLSPMKPWPYTLTLQYLNNQHLDYKSIHAVGEQAEWLKELVRRAHERLE